MPGMDHWIGQPQSEIVAVFLNVQAADGNFDSDNLEDAMEELRRNAGTQFDSEVVEALLRALVERRQQAARP